MNRMPFYRSAFFRFTMVFLLLGLLPIMVLLLLFYVRYQDNAKRVMESHYTQRNYWMEENVGSLIDSVDETMGYVYDFSNGDYDHFYEAVKNHGDENETKRMQTIQQMLREMRTQNPRISSIRFEDADGTLFVSYANQGKSPIDGKGIYRRLGECPVAEYRNLFLQPTVYEGDFCTNSTDYVFTLVRNIMDTSRIRLTRSEILGTLYVDINVDELASIEERSREEDEAYYILLRESGDLLYSAGAEDYRSGSALVKQCLPYLAEDEGNFSLEGRTVFYRAVDGTDAIILTILPENMLLNGAFENRTGLIALTGILLTLLFLVYLFISRQLSDPVRNLTGVMEAVQKGDFSARAESGGADEMGILADGFNRMVEDLSNYIDRMYVAELRQREAELSALKMQIRPHYLYNTLDVIRMTAVENEDEATAQLLLSLSAQLRYVMGTQGDMVRLSEELNNIQSYFVIVRARYENRFSLSIDVSDEQAELYVLKLMLQPFVENAIRHALRAKKGPGTISISASIVEGRLVLQIMDDGVGIPEETVQRINRVLAGEEAGEMEMGVGMKNVADRIRMNCGEDCGVSLTSYEGIGTIVKLILPIVETIEDSHRGS